MPNMTGGHALIGSLKREGVSVIFGMPGVQMYHALDPLIDEPDMRFITVRHEQAAAYMADGYARGGGGIGTALVVPGPGLQNASAGIGTAYAASSPILVVAGQIPSRLIGVRRGMLHEIDDQLDTIRPVTKWAHRILDPAETPSAVHEAFRQLKTGRPRPVEIEMPPDTLAKQADIELLEPGIHVRRPAPSSDVREAARLLGAASKPVIWAGGGVISSGASGPLLDVAEHMQAPILTTSEGKGAVSDRHQLSIGGLRYMGEPLIEKGSEFDLVLVVGSRFATVTPPGDMQVVQIDIDEEEIGRNHQPTFGLCGDAAATLRDLHGVLTTSVPRRADAGDRLETFKAIRRSQLKRTEPQASLTAALRAGIPEDGIVVAGMTQIGYYSRIHFPVYQPGTYLTSSYYGNLGYAFPTALGAKVADPDRPVVAVSGDGGFMFNSQELATAVQYGINAIVVVFNDNALGNVRRDQQLRFNGREIGGKLHNPDFVKLAEAYGARGIRADGPEELERALKESIAANDAPVLIEVPVGPMPSPFEN